MITGYKISNKIIAIMVCSVPNSGSLWPKRLFGMMGLILWLLLQGKFRVGCVASSSWEMRPVSVEVLVGGVLEHLFQL